MVALSLCQLALPLASKFFSFSFSFFSFSFENVFGNYLEIDLMPFGGHKYVITKVFSTNMKMEA